jgi:polyphosphate kinase
VSTGERKRAPARPRAPRAKEPVESRYFQRELSWIEFDARVLELSRDADLPLLERLRSVSFFASNLDEFFMVRVAGLVEDADAGRRTPAGEPSLREVIAKLTSRSAELLALQSRILQRDLLPALAEQGIRILTLDECSDEERSALDATFHRAIFPVLTPLAVGPGQPFPYISGLSLSLGVLVRDPETGQRRFARVKVPEVLPRFTPVGDDESRFLPLERLIAANLDALFPGMVIEEHTCFRVTRDADFEIQEEATDVMHAVEQELRRRRFGDAVRLEIDAAASIEMRELLERSLPVDPAYVYAIDGLLDAADFSQLANLDRPDLRYPPWDGVTQERLRGPDDESADVFAAMRAGDILVHHPYDSFETSVERMLEQAVEDPNVLAIKHTIYRTSGDSPVVRAMIRAAEQGKQAVALVELKARFDEEQNVSWSRALERAGVHVVHGFADLKTHAKCALVVRREAGGIRRYAHIGTGNYHPRTARLYTDIGMFTARPDLTADVADLFNYLTGFARPRRYRKLLVAPLDFRDRIVEELERVVEAHREGQPTRVVMKMNSIVDRASIDALYEASQAGVPIDLLIRGTCCLRPGVPGLSETITVRSLLGRFLEHERVYMYRIGDERRLFVGSGDLMPRNLDNRVEVIAPIEDPALVKEIDDVLEIVLADNRGSWTLGPDGSWTRVPREGKLRSAQDELIERARARGRSRESVPREEDRVVRRPSRPGVET